MLYALPVLPYAGLGNMLLPWARAVAFCHRTGAKMIGPRWFQLPHIGPWLRGEKCKRFYVADFKNGSVLDWARGRIMSLALPHIDEADWTGETKNAIVRFSKFGGEKGFFESLGDAHDVVVDRFWQMVKSSISAYAMALSDEGPFIGVHVRRGDFSTLGIAASDDWYVDALGKALEMDSGRHVCVRVFSDAHPRELNFIKKSFPKEEIIVMPKAPASQDILSLSKSTVLVASPESTFSMWAVYCGQMPSIWPKGCLEHGIYASESKAVYV